MHPKPLWRGHLNLNNKQIEHLELINCICWLLLDASWMLELRYFCVVFAFPTLLTGLLLIWATKKIVRLANVGIFLWSLMNVFWMSSDLTKDPTLLKFAHLCFVTGAIIITYVVTRSPDLRKGLVKRVQVLRNIAKDQPKE